MATRSLGSRLALGSLLWTLGGAAVAVALLAGVVHLPHAYLSYGLHFGAVGFAAAVLLIAGLLQLRTGLSHFDELRARLQDVRTGAATQVTGDYPPEVQPLVSDLNTVLAQQTAAVSRAQARAGDLAHGLKTPLAVIAHEADRAAAAGQSDLAESLRQQVTRLQRHVDYHLAHARAASAGTATARALVRASVDGLVRALSRLHADRGLTIGVDVADDVAVRVQPADLDEMLGNLLDNACKWARHEVRVTARRSEGRIVVTIDDDGPGIAPELRAAVLLRGVRVDETAPGSGLGLAIVRDLAAIYDAELALDTNERGGLRVTLGLVAAPTAA